MSRDYCVCICVWGGCIARQESRLWQEVVNRVAVDDDVDVLVEQPHENVEALVVQELRQQPAPPPTHTQTHTHTLVLVLKLNIHLSDAWQRYTHTQTHTHIGLCRVA